MSITMPVTQKGQVTLPKEFRNFLGIRPRDRVKFSLKNNKVVLSSASEVDDLWKKIPKSSPFFSDEEIQTDIKNNRY